MPRYAHLATRAAEVVRDPVAWTEGLQMLKTVVAAVVAWVVASEVFDLPQAFLAPWSALLVVHATVYSSFWKGGRQVVAAVLGVLLAWATGSLFGTDPVTLGVMLLVALLVSQARWLRDEATTVAATAMFVLTTGSSNEEHVDDWLKRSQALDDEVDAAWALVRQARESGRLNPRKDSAVVRKPGAFGEILDRTEQALAEIRSMARTIGHSISATNSWDGGFRDRWTGLLHEVGRAIQNRDVHRLTELRTKLSALAADYSDEDLSSRHWPEYGGLILNLRNITSSMDDVAASDPVSASSRGPLGASAL